MLFETFLPKATRALVLVPAFLFAGACSNTPVADGDSSDTSTPPQGGQRSGTSQGQNPQQLEQDRTDLFVETYLQNAEAERRAGNLELARSEVLKAKRLAPTDDRANRLLAAINAELGNEAGAIETFGEQSQRMGQIREERARERVSAQVARAREALDQQDFDRAIDELRRAEIEIEVSRYVDWNGLDEQVGALLEQARQERAANEEALLAQSRAEVERQLIEVERERARRRRESVEMSVDRAARAFDARRFQLSAEFAQRALDLDPQNDTALTILNAAQKARRDEKNDRYYRELSMRIRRMIEAEDRSRIPQTETLQIDLATWERASARAADTEFRSTLPVENEALRERLGTETVTNLSFDDEAYDEVKTRLQTITNLPIIITPAARDVIDSEGLTLTMQITSPISVENLLQQMVSASAELAWTIREGVVEITSRELAGGDNVGRVVDVRDLVFPQTQFTPPQIDSIPVDDGGGFDAAPRTGGELDEPIIPFEVDGLVSTLQDATGRDYWEAGDARLEPIEAGYIYVVANARQQQRIDDVLRDLRRFSTSVVTIESKFLTITQNFLQEIGVDFTGLGGAGNPGTVVPLDDITNGLDDNSGSGLDNGGTGDPGANPFAGFFFNDGGDGDVRGRTQNLFSNPLGSALSSTGGLTAALTWLDDVELQAIVRAVEKQQDVQELNSQNLTVLNNGRGHVAVINQTAYIKDFDVEVAQAAFIADPKVDVVQDGVVLDVKPTVNYDRKTITLDLQPTVAQLLLPIPTFSTSLAGTTQPVTIQLPILIVQSFQTTATVPDGGSILIGGLRKIATTERQAEVPVLGKIPILGFLFRQEGVSDERSNLAVLVRATITDVLDRMTEFDRRRS
jgi:general secretion pathway protein D